MNATPKSPTQKRSKFRRVGTKCRMHGHILHRRPVNFEGNIAALSVSLVGNTFVLIVAATTR
jgi:hypothetical protein